MSDQTLETVATPAVVIDLPTVWRNIRRMQSYCRAHGLHLRPHTKTHKSLFMARLQLDGGAVGLTVAKAGEAEGMAHAADDVDMLVAYPALDPARVCRLADLARIRTIRVAVDSALAVDRLADAARQAGSTLGVLVDLDVGLHRTGVQTPAEALSLAVHIARSKGVRLDGLVVYPGHVKEPAEQQPAALRPVAELLQATLDLWRSRGLEARIVSGGSTPTAERSHLMPGLTEIRPGTYIYNDMNCIAGGFCSPEDVAARVICTVVSDAVPGKVVIDAGSKTLTQDRLSGDPAGQAGHGFLPDYPDARVVRLTEEHGEVDVSRCPRRPRLGERVAVIPNHICPCINLHDAVWLSDGRDNRLRMLPIDVRGRTS